MTKVFIVMDQLSYYFKQIGPEKFMKSLEDLKVEQKIGFSLIFYIGETMMKKLKEIISKNFIKIK